MIVGKCINELSVDESFKFNFSIFIKEVENRYIKYMSEFHRELSLSELERILALKIEEGRRYIKIIIFKNGRISSNEGIHSFIDKHTGDILKPASWSAPAKKARGNIFINFGFDSMYADNYFIKYLESGVK